MIVRTAFIPLLSVASWLGVIQAVPSVAAGDGMARSIGVASVLATLTVLVYRLGVWRQEMEHTKHNVLDGVKAHREESTANFARMDRRLDGIAHRMQLLERRQAARLTVNAVNTGGVA